MLSTGTLTGMETQKQQRERFEPSSVSAVLGRVLPGLGLDEAKATRISKAYELAEGIKDCPGCGYDDMDGKISVDIGNEEHYLVKCHLLTPRCRYGQVLYERIERACVEYVKAIPALPRRFHSQLDTPQSTAAVKGANRWSFKHNQKCFLTLHGGHGTGKSFGAAYALCLLDRKRLLVDWDKPYKWTHVKALWTSAYRLAADEETFKAAQNVSVLVIDDLGGEESTPRARGKIAETVSERYNCMGLTIITTNDSMESLEKVYGRRMYDRVMDAGDDVDCHGESLRLVS